MPSVREREKLSLWGRRRIILNLIKLRLNSFPRAAGVTEGTLKFPSQYLNTILLPHQQQLRQVETMA